MEIAAAAIERCHDLQRQVAANVNQANAVEAWLIDLGKICRGGERCENLKTFGISSRTYSDRINANNCGVNFRFARAR